LRAYVLNTKDIAQYAILSNGDQSATSTPRTLL
jgi:hypothetical protein